MAIARTEKITDTKHRVISYHSAPETLTEAQKEGSITINSVPIPQQQVGKSTLLFCNPQTGEVWYEYQDRPLTKEEMETEEAIEKVKKTVLDELKAEGKIDQAVYNEKIAKKVDLAK